TRFSRDWSSDVCSSDLPEQISCHYLLGRAQVRTEQYTLAAESFKRAVDLGSTNGYHYWWAGRAQVLLGSCPAATQYLQTGYQIRSEERRVGKEGRSRWE